MPPKRDPDNTNETTKKRKKGTEDQEDDDGEEEDDMFAIGEKIFCVFRKDNTYRLCKVLSRNKISKMYYVNWAEFNRRNDCWVDAEYASRDDPQKDRKRGDIVEFVEEDYGDAEPMDINSIIEHENITKIKNVNRLQLGRNIIDTWYFSPLPKEYTPGDSIDLLYVSDFTLEFFRFEDEIKRHYEKCKIRHPPGDELYRDDELHIAMFEVDGAKAKFYCQNLCYLAKFFLDHKTLHYDVDPFLFYILCEYDDRGYHFVGYFSKEKLSEVGYNLACILTLPPYQRKGYGKFLIQFSYELSKKEGKVGSPEKPLSDLGQISYRSYWSHAILQYFSDCPDLSEVKVIDIMRQTSIKSEDVILALKFLSMLKYVNGNPCICVDPNDIKQKLKQHTWRGARVHPEKIHWAPLRVKMVKDKWALNSKTPASTGGNRNNNNNNDKSNE